MPHGSSHLQRAAFSQKEEEFLYPSSLGAIQWGDWEEGLAAPSPLGTEGGMETGAPTQEKWLHEGHCFYRRQEKPELQKLEETSWLQGGLGPELSHSFATHAAASSPRHPPLPSKSEHLSSSQHVTGFTVKPGQLAASPSGKLVEDNTDVLISWTPLTSI